MEEDKKRKGFFKSIQVRVNVKTIEIIDRAVELGYGNSRGDFGSMAIISKLEELGLFDLEIQKLIEKSKES